MLYARTPFRGDTQQDTFNHILHQKLVLPPMNSYGPVSRPCRDLIKRLLNCDTNKRLGHKHGASDIKSHAFFKGTKWENVPLQQPSTAILQKDNLDILDFSNFQPDLIDSDEDLEPIVLDAKKIQEIETKNKLFKSFVFTPKTPTDGNFKPSYSYFQ